VIYELSRRDALDLVIGAKILANGGGGSEEEATRLIHECYDDNLRLRMASCNEFKPKEQICIIGMVGGGITKEEKAITKNLPIITEDPMIAAVEKLEEYLTIRFQGFVATELGPLNSIIPLVVAARMPGKVGINGDCCGRSKPQISISTTTVGEISISPFSIASRYGDEMIVGATMDDVRGEVIARTIAKISNGSIGVARCPMRIEQANKAIIPNTLSLAMRLGKKVRRANEESKEPISAIISEVPEIYMVMRGTVSSFRRVEEGGFTAGEIIIRDSEAKNSLKIYYKNEYVLTWLNDQQFISCPDSLPLVDAKTGYGLTPWEEDLTEGREVVILARDAPKIWQSVRGLQVFGPQIFEPAWTKYTVASEMIAKNIKSE
jgi:DUF917 family protein